MHRYVEGEFVIGEEGLCHFVYVTFDFTFDFNGGHYRIGSEWPVCNVDLPSTSLRSKRVEIRYARQHTNHYRVCPKCYTSLLPSEMLDFPVELTRKCEHDRLQIEKERERIEARAAHLKARLAEGKPQIKARQLITLLDLGTQEQLSCYLIRGSVWSRFNEPPIFEDKDPIPNLPDGVCLIRTGSPMGSKLLGSFVGDELSIDAPDGTVAYRILWTESLTAAYSRAKLAAQSNRQSEDCSIYAGRGKNDGTQSDVLDGSRYIGFMARDSGQWGSFPMHDDYGDESDAEGKDYGEWAE